MDREEVSTGLDWRKKTPNLRAPAATDRFLSLNYTTSHHLKTGRVTFRACAHTQPLFPGQDANSLPEKEKSQHLPKHLPNCHAARRLQLISLFSVEPDARPCFHDFIVCFKYRVGKPYVSVSGMTKACSAGLYPKKLKLRRNWIICWRLQFICKSHGILVLSLNSNPLECSTWNVLSSLSTGQKRLVPKHGSTENNKILTAHSNKMNWPSC